MLDEIIGGFFRVIGKAVADVFVQVVFEMLIKGTGYLIAKSIFKQQIDPDGVLSITCGIAFWLIFALGCFYIFSGPSTAA